MKSIQLFAATLAFLCTAALAEEDKQIKIAAGGKAALQLSVPKDAKITTKGTKTFIQAESVSVYLWHIPKATSVADVASRVGDIIKSEFLKLVPDDTKSLKVLDHVAKEVSGKGAEADDNDEGAAIAVVFTDGKNIYVACVHGEGDHASQERPELIKILDSAKAL
jgi:hypothetical protein